ncbi:MAG: FkbM family methyltransferase [Chitinophagales bacterium]|nr:FkbM family methyltransferase [Chitinophagales bacterium]
MGNDIFKLLTESSSDAQKRAANTFDILSDGAKQIILFGSGDLGRRTLKGARELGVDIVCFCDNNEKIWGNEVDGLKILSPIDALNQYPKAVIVLTIWSAYVGHPLVEIQNQINAIRPCKVISFLHFYWKYPSTFLPYWRCELPHKTLEQFELVGAAASLWSDEQSLNEYVGQVIWRITGDSSKLTTPVKDDQYFPEDIFGLVDDEVFIDIGAFDGDTLKVFQSKSKNQFKAYFAYEPDPFGCVKLQEYANQLEDSLKSKISIAPIGVGSHPEKIQIQTPGVYFKILYPEETSAIAKTAVSEYASVDSMPLDITLKDAAPTYIKMDVEGFEPNIIFGARETIATHQPIVAISIYHQFDHLWRLPLAVHAIFKDYNFYLRPHFHAGWELICYCVPKHRIKKQN